MILAPHLMAENLLEQHEYLTITGRMGVSPNQHFKIFVIEYLSKADKGDIVKIFLSALSKEKKHMGHADLFKRIQKNEKIMSKFTITVDTSVYYMQIDVQAPKPYTGQSTSSTIKR